MSSPGPDPKDIFAEALRLTDPAERAAYLDRVCAGNAAFRQEVESLLAAHVRAGDFLNRTEPMREPDVEVEHPGNRVGRYKLLEKIGEGGFGAVWMAEQEEPVRRRVALKIIKLGMDTKEVVARFEAERQALALMDHPNIASVFDGGATDTGRPYFVMELVKGVPITEYCDANRLSPDERMKLFVQVCQAVQHAHQKGVIHRDLKPSNILVTVKDDRPVPKVIDFGVAKATQARLTEKTLFTRLHQWIGTPAYMSPEQAGLGSLDVDTRSDIYSLGVLLYELLTGRTPFDMPKLLAAGYDAVMRTIREEEPPKPSTRLSTLAEEELNVVAVRRGTEPAKLGRLVHGDLDWIVMKCLEKDRTRRYETANNLALDLQRHLNQEPVTAAPPSTLYRARRLLLRNKAAAAFTTALVFSLVGGTVLSWRYAWRASKFATEADGQRRLAESALSRAEASAYGDRVALASQRIEAGDVSQADQLLEACPAPLRRWEWHYLKRQCQPACRVLGGQSNEVWSLAASLDGRWLASLDMDGRLLLWDLKGDLSNPALTWPAAARTGTDHPLPINRRLAFSHDSLNLAWARWTGWERGWAIELVPVAGNHVARELSHIRKTGIEPLCLSFSGDDRRLMVGWSDGFTRSYDVITGDELSGYPIMAAAFSTDGSRVVSLGVRRVGWEHEHEPARMLRMFDTFNGRELLAITNLSEPPSLFSAALSPDGKHVAAGFAEVGAEKADNVSGMLHAERGTVVVWELPTGTEILRHRLAKAAPVDLEFSADGRHLAIACAGLSYMVIIAGGGDTFYGIYTTHISNPGKVLILDVHSSEEIASLRGYKHDVTSVAFTGGGKRLASATSDRTICLCELSPSRIVPLGGRWIKEPGDPTFYPQSLCPLGSDGRMIAVSTPDTNWDVIDLANGKTVGSVPIPEYHRIHDAALTKSPPGLICLSDRALYYRDLAAGGESWSLSSTDLDIAPERLAISPDGRRVVLAPGPGRASGPLRLSDVALLEAGTGRLIMRTNLLGAGGIDLHRVVEGGTGRVTMQTNVVGIGGIAFSPDSRFLVAGDMEGNVRVWDATSGGEVLRQRAAEARPGASIFDLSPEEPPSNRRTPGTGIPVTAVAVSPDGSHLATAAGMLSAELRLWDMATKQPKWVRPLASGAGAMAFSPDSSRLAVACVSLSETTTDLVIFDTHSGQELLHLPSRAAIESLAFSPDGARLWAVTKGGMLVFWDATPWPGPITPPAVALRGSVVESAEHKSNTGP